MRISIEVTPAQHKRLKAMAALEGESIKDYVLKRTLPDTDENSALKELESFLEPRVKAAKSGLISDKSVGDIFDAVLKEVK